MDGRNSSGRRISLLNDADSSAAAAAAAALCSRNSSYNSSSDARSYSYSSTPCLSPQTPSLSRSTSSDSTNMHTPSPVTPSFSSFDSLPLPLPHQSAKAVLSSYPQVSHGAAGSLPYPQVAFGRPSSPDGASSTGTAPSANPKSKKNSYPCPLASQYSCSDYFTTSGHAARHAKKHTGKKDAFCPECNKAFTRKDNMEQHRRTHQSGRNASKPASSAEKKPKMQQQQQSAMEQPVQHTVVRRPKPMPLQAPAVAVTMAVAAVDPLLPLSPFATTHDSFGAVDYAHRYPDPTHYALHPYAVSPSYALDTLAIAASGEKRKYDGCS